MGMYSDPISDLIARLTWHTQDIDGRLLRGYKFNPIPISRVEGISDFPCISIFSPSIADTYKPARGIKGEMKIHLIVTTARTEGLPNLMSAVEEVLDAVECTAEATPRIRSLSGACLPFNAEMESGEYSVVDISLNAFLTLNIETKQRDRAQRKT